MNCRLTALPSGLTTTFFNTACPGALDINRLIELANEGGQDVLQDEQMYELWRMGLWREPSQPEAQEYSGKVDTNTIIHAIYVSPERADHQQVIDTGRMALKDDWPGQIENLLQKNKDLATNLASLTKQAQGQAGADAGTIEALRRAIDEKQSTIEKLQNQLEKTIPSVGSPWVPKQSQPPVTPPNPTSNNQASTNPHLPSHNTPWWAKLKTWLGLP
jgi:hypothetical protein